ncbi:DUF3192 domain-containing protein [Candidatus Enterovibrio escicola]|uniref:DUF3192 domain-containing protein n=1 Tax=Candidatus Enterovibrio escicola TaxID=1927127 RepID=UPI0012383CB9|nr:DUF3192 domain-containing protein [Candidatus Enterovibrio escacola]
MKFLIAALTLLVAGCVNTLEKTVDDYKLLSQRVDLGMSKQEVQRIISPSQSRLTNREIKQSEIYMKDGITVEILYFRSGWQDDNLVTDDEYTPYIFNNNKLVAIGWQTLEGPKSHGQAVPRIFVNRYPPSQHHRIRS